MDNGMIELAVAAMGGGAITGGGSVLWLKLVLNGLREDVRGMREHMQKMDRRLSRMEGRHEPYDARGSE